MHWSIQTSIYNAWKLQNNAHNLNKNVIPLRIDLILGRYNKFYTHLFDLFVDKIYTRNDTIMNAPKTVLVAQYTFFGEYH